MLPAERHRRILERLESGTSASTAELIDLLGVTAMTVWRDLRLLEEQGMLTRVRGGAMRAEVREEPQFNAKLMKHRAAKEKMAARAARDFVKPGDTIILEGGTTIVTLASRLIHPGLNIMTNSLQVIHNLSGIRQRHAIHCCGGLLRERSGTFVGRQAESYFPRRRAATFFMSATGIDETSGVTDPNPQEIEVKRAMARAAKRVVLLADASKTGQTSLMEVLPWGRIDTWITNAPVPAPLRRHCRGEGVAIVVA